MTKQFPTQKEKSIRRLLAEKRRLNMEKELLTFLCLILVMALGMTLILI